MTDVISDLLCDPLCDPLCGPLCGPTSNIFSLESSHSPPPFLKMISHKSLSDQIFDNKPGHDVYMEIVDFGRNDTQCQIFRTTYQLIKKYFDILRFEYRIIEDNLKNPFYSPREQREPKSPRCSPRLDQQQYVFLSTIGTEYTTRIEFLINENVLLFEWYNDINDKIDTDPHIIKLPILDDSAYSNFFQYDDSHEEIISKIVGIIRSNPNIK